MRYQDMHPLSLLPVIAILFLQYMVGCTTKRCLLGRMTVPESMAHRYVLGQTVIDHPYVCLVQRPRVQEYIICLI